MMVSGPFVGFNSKNDTKLGNASKIGITAKHKNTVKLLTSKNRFDPVLDIC